MFVAVLGGFLFTILSFITYIVKRDRRIISIGLKLLMFTAIAGILFFMMLVKLLEMLVKNF